MAIENLNEWIHESLYYRNKHSIYKSIKVYTYAHVIYKAFSIIETHCCLSLSSYMYHYHSIFTIIILYSPFSFYIHHSHSIFTILILYLSLSFYIYHYHSIFTIIILYSPLSFYIYHYHSIFTIIILCSPLSFYIYHYHSIVIITILYLNVCTQYKLEWVWNFGE